jgi:citrate lyase subunit beta/citryl-CoA lyase
MPNPASRPPRRSVLYVPALNARAIAKARALDVDALIFDLEDAVAPGMKQAARQTLAGAFAEGGFGHRETVVRINAVDSPEWQADLETVAICRPDAVLLPKVSSPDDLRTLATALGDAGLGDAMRMWAMVETSAGLLRLDEWVLHGLALGPALDCLVVGTNDIAKETGVDPGDERRYLLPWLMQVVLVAKRHGVCVLDGVWNDFSDTAGFDAEARQSVKMAFDGKTLIHPSQVAPANQWFTPPEATLAQARAVVAAFQLPEHANAGVIKLEGRMVERLHLAQAERLLAFDDALAQRHKEAADVPPLAGQVPAGPA